MVSHGFSFRQIDEAVREVTKSCVMMKHLIDELQAKVRAFEDRKEEEGRQKKFVVNRNTNTAHVVLVGPPRREAAWRTQDVEFKEHLTRQ